MTFNSSIRSEILKTRKTPVAYLVLFTAFVVPFVIFVNYLQLSDESTAIEPWGDYFMNGHEIINFMFIELFIILSSTLLMQTEYRNNAWKQVITSPQSFASIYFSKFVILQILIVTMLIMFNVFMILFAAILQLIHEEDFLSYLSRWPEILTLMARTYVSTLGISAFCYWLALRFKNFVISTAVGFGLYMIGPFVLFEFAGSFSHRYPFAMPILIVIEKYRDQAFVYQGISLGYAMIFLVGGYADFLLRHVTIRSLIPVDAIGNPFNIGQTLKSIVLVAWRSLVRDRYYAIINITGLTIGLASSMFLFIYISDELSFDKYHKNADNIYRVISEITETDNAFTWPSSPIPLADEITQKGTGIRNAVRFIKTSRTMYRYKDREFYEENIYLADPKIFDTFSWDFIAGDPSKALLQPHSIILSAGTASKYFDKPIDAVGEQIENQDKETYTITGIIKEIPENSHFHFDGLISMSTDTQNLATNWGRLGALTYLELADDFDKDDFKNVLDSIVHDKIDPVYENRGITMKLSLQPITSIHLHSKLADEAEGGGDISYIYVFSAVAILILVIACINYMNLTTARSIGRIREVGIRKVVGSLRHQIITQFLIESLCVAFIAFGLSILLIYLLLPGFNFLSSKSLEFGSVMNMSVISWFTVTTIIVGLFAGSYPALYLSGFNPADVLKGNLISKMPNDTLRKTLVILQFSISIFMVIATLIIYNQMNFMRTKDLGFTKQHVIRIPLSGQDQRKNFPLLTHELKKLPEVVSIGMTSATPGERIGKALLKVENDDGRFSDRGVDVLSADYNYVTTMGMTIVQGRNFDENIPSDTLYAILVNESMVKRMGWADPIGKRFRPQRKSKDGREIEKRVVGVVKDYNQSSLYDAIEPMIIALSDKSNDNVLVRIAPGDTRRSIDAISMAWSAAFPNDPLDFRFLEDDFDSQYHADEKRSYVFTVFAALTMLIACLGLLGLAAYSTERRTKEIGVRKIAGATAGNLVLLITKDFLRLIVTAILIAIPLTWYLTNEWLENFAYRIELINEWPTFLLAGGGSVIITLITTGYHVIRSARTNPVYALRR